jgi:hypothetical protein
MLPSAPKVTAPILHSHGPHRSHPTLIKLSLCKESSPSNWVSAGLYLTNLPCGFKMDRRIEFFSSWKCRIVGLGDCPSFMLVFSVSFSYSSGLVYAWVFMIFVSDAPDYPSFLLSCHLILESWRPSWLSLQNAVFAKLSDFVIHSQNSGCFKSAILPYTWGFH